MNSNVNNNVSKPSNPMFLYLSIVLVGVAVLFYFFGNRLLQNNPSLGQDVKKQPVIERAAVIPLQPLSRENLVLPDSQGVGNEVIPLSTPSDNLLKTRLFFVSPTDDGQFNLKSSVAGVNYRGKAELTATLEALIQGLSPSGQSNNLYSMIPEGTRLLSATVKDGTAYLNFNENFRFNSFGLDGYTAQLAQVVYTATEFPTVQRVKILIDGQDIDYLSEGVDVSQPLTRY